MKASHGKSDTAGMRAWTKRQRLQRRRARAALRHPKHRGAGHE
jgi:hypothetical protein